MQSLGLKTPIILDNGSGYCKCGFANQTIPSVEFPAYVGRPKYNQTMSREFKDAYVGMEAQSMRGVLRLNYPLEHGIVTHWDDMEKVRARVCGNDVPFASLINAFALLLAICRYVISFLANLRHHEYVSSHDVSRVI